MTGLLKPSEVAARLSFSPRHVRALAERGELPGFKLGTDWRFSPEAVEAYLAARATGATASAADETTKPEASRSKEGHRATAVAGFSLPDDYTPVFPDLWANGAPTRKTAPQRH